MWPQWTAERGGGARYQAANAARRYPITPTIVVRKHNRIDLVCGPQAFDIATSQLFGAEHVRAHRMDVGRRCRVCQNWIAAADFDRLLIASKSSCLWFDGCIKPNFHGLSSTHACKYSRLKIQRKQPDCDEHRWPNSATLRRKSFNSFSVITGLVNSGLRAMEKPC